MHNTAAGIYHLNKLLFLLSCYTNQSVPSKTAQIQKSNQEFFKPCFLLKNVTDPTTCGGG